MTGSLRARLGLLVSIARLTVVRVRWCAGPLRTGGRPGPGSRRSRGSRWRARRHPGHSGGRCESSVSNRSSWTRPPNSLLRPSLLTRCLAIATLSRARGGVGQDLTVSVRYITATLDASDVRTPDSEEPLLGESIRLRCGCVDLLRRSGASRPSAPRPAVAPPRPWALAGLAGSAPRACSRKRSSSTGNGSTSVEFFSAATSTTVSSSRSCSAAGCRPSPRGLGELLRRLQLAVGGDDAGAPFTLGLGLPRHGALHRLGQRDVLDLDAVDVHAPVQRPGCRSSARGPG